MGDKQRQHPTWQVLKNERSGSFCLVVFLWGRGWEINVGKAGIPVPGDGVSDSLSQKEKSQDFYLLNNKKRQRA